ncbi:MAG: hypothetical protein WDM70_09385 [Nitrosomonadales bacterium]
MIQEKLKHWQEEAEQIKLQLAQLSDDHSTAPLSTAASPSIPFSSPGTSPLPKAATLQQPVVQSNDPNLQNLLFLTLGLLLILLALWKGLRFYTNLN